MFSKKESRLASRRLCHGEVLVYQLAGGAPLKGRLADVGEGGVRVALDRPLEEAALVRLVFPNRRAPSSTPGRMIIGQVAHSRLQSGSYQIGIAFGWLSAMGGSPTIRRDEAAPGWLGSFWRKVRHGLASSVR
jgi:hypothetical protein